MHPPRVYGYTSIGKNVIITLSVFNQSPRIWMLTPSARRDYRVIHFLCWHGLLIE